MEQEVIVLKVQSGTEGSVASWAHEIGEQTGSLVVILPHETDLLLGERAKSELERFHEEIHKILEKEE